MTATGNQQSPRPTPIPAEVERDSVLRHTLAGVSVGSQAGDDYHNAPWRESLFWRLLENLPTGAYMCDPDGLITYYNRHAVGIWGRAPQLRDPEDRFCGSFRLFAADGSPIRHDQCWMALALQKNTGFNGCEIIVERPDGGRFTMLAYANPVHDESGTLLGAVNVLVDITERKCAEEALRQADRQKDEFLAVLAHELRNPLAPVLNAVRILQARGADDPVLQRQQDTIERQATHMARLLDDLLDVARISRGKVELRLEPVALETIIGQAVESCRTVVEQRKQSLSVIMAPQPLHVYADPTRLHQIIGNLLSNASKYTPEGGSVFLTTAEESGQAVIRVRDTGIGIPPEFLPHVFDLFAQASLPTGRVEGGLGIGLTIVRQLVELHGGTIRALSEGPNRGSEFEMRLSLTAMQPEMLRRPSIDQTTTRAAARSRRVLIVDDNRDAAETLAELARLWGLEVETAPDGRTAVELAARFNPQIVVLDISMPGMDGYEVARRLRSAPDAPPLSLIALTGFGQERDRRRAIEAGFDHYLTKPVDADALLNLFIAD